MRNAQTGESFAFGNDGRGWALATHPLLAAAEEVLPVGSSERLHRHDRARQLFYVLEGHAELVLDGRAVRLASGDSLEVPPRLAHLIRNAGTVALRFLVVSAPATTGDRVDLHRAAGSARPDGITYHGRDGHHA